MYQPAWRRKFKKQQKKIMNNNLQQLRKISLDLQKATIKKDMHTA